MVELFPRPGKRAVNAGNRPKKSFPINQKKGSISLFVGFVKTDQPVPARNVTF
jgi:hypothetical protein